MGGNGSHSSGSGTGRYFPLVFSWDWDGKRLIFVGVGRERFENALPCHPLIESVNVIHYLPISEERLKIISGEEEKDDTLQTLIKTIREGWPTNKRNVPNEIVHYYSFQDELTVQDGIVFKGERVYLMHSEVT